MKIEHLALQVPDPIALADWYVKHLGLAVARSTGEPTHTRFLIDSSGAVMLEVYRHPKATIPDYNLTDPLHLHLALQSDNPTADRDRLVKAGAKLVDDVQTTANGDQLVMLRDPWGIAVQLVHRAAPMLKVG